MAILIMENSPKSSSTARKMTKFKDSMSKTFNSGALFLNTDSSILVLLKGRI